MAERIDVVDIEFGNSQQEADKLTKSLDELKQELYSLEKGSDAYNKKLQEVAAETKRLTAINEELEQSTQSAGEKFETVLGAAAGFAGAIQIAEGTLQAFGIQSEAAEEAIAKLQGVMAITDGLRTIKENAKAITDLGKMIKSTTAIQKLFTSAKKEDAATTNAQTAAMTGYTTATTTATTATKALKTALITSGIGAILVGIGYAVSMIVDNWDKWFSTAEKTTAIIDNLKEINEEVNGLEISSQKMFDINLQYINGVITNTGKLWAEYIEYQKVTKEANDNLIRANEELRKGISDGLLTSEEDIKEAEENIKSITEIANDWEEKRIEKLREFIAEGAKESKKERDAQKKRAEEERDAQKKRAEEAIKIEKEKNKAIIEAYDEMNTRINTSTDNQWLMRKTKLKDQYREDVETARKYFRLKLSDAVEFNNAFNKELEKLTGILNTSLDKIDKEGRTVYDEIIATTADLNLTRELNELQNRYNYYKKSLDDLKESSIISTNEYNTAIKSIDEWWDKNFESIIAKDYVSKYINNVENDMIEGLRSLNEAVEKSANDPLQNIFDREKLLAQEKIYLEETIKTYKEIISMYSPELQKEMNSYLVQLEERLSVNTSSSIQLLTEKVQTYSNIVSKSLSTTSSFMSDIASFGEGVSSEWISVTDIISESVNTIGEQLSVLAAKMKDGQADWKDYGQVIASSLTSAFQIGSGMMTALVAKQQQIIDDIDGNDAASMKRKAEAFEKQKQYEVVGATMSMLGGITAAIATAFQLGPIMGPIIGSINAALVATTGGLQISQIKKQKNPYGGSSSSSDTATPSLSSLQMLGQGVNPTTEIEGASVEGKVKDTRVVVLESEIRNTMNRVQVAEQESTF